MAASPDPKAKKAAAERAARKRKNLLRRAASGTLLAASLAATQLDTDEATGKWRQFSPRLLDRLQPPLTRYHE